jgi:hypothetical protein
MNNYIISVSAKLIPGPRSRQTGTERARPSPRLRDLSMSMPQILTFPETMMFTDFAESGLVLKARPM